MSFGVIFADGFDHYNSQTLMGRKWTVPRTNGFATGRFGRGQYTKADSGGPCVLSFTSTHQTIVIGLAFMSTNVSSQNNIFQLQDSGTAQVILYLNSDGSISIYRGSSSNVLQRTAAGLILSNTWYYLELYVKIASGTSGAYEVRLNTTNSILSNGACNTQQTANAYVNQFSFPADNIGGAGNSGYDDLVISTSGSFIGEVEIRTQYPASDSSVQFTKNTGASNYACVNQTSPDDDTTYVEDANVGEIDLYGFSAMSPAPTSIIAVAINGCVKKSDSGARSGNNHISSSGTVAEGSVLALPTSYINQQDIWETDPHTSSAWTIAAVNALLGGQKVAA